MTQSTRCVGTADGKASSPGPVRRCDAGRQRQEDPHDSPRLAMLAAELSGSIYRSQPRCQGGRGASSRRRGPHSSVPDVDHGRHGGPVRAVLRDDATVLTGLTLLLARTFADRLRRSPAWKCACSGSGPRWGGKGHRHTGRHGRGAPRHEGSGRRSDSVSRSMTLGGFRRPQIATIRPDLTTSDRKEDSMRNSVRITRLVALTAPLTSVAQQPGPRPPLLREIMEGMPKARSRRCESSQRLSSLARRRRSIPTAFP